MTFSRLIIRTIKSWRSQRAEKALERAIRKSDRAMPELVEIQQTIERNRRHHRPNKEHLDRIRKLRFQKLREGV